MAMAMTAMATAMAMAMVGVVDEMQWANGKKNRATVLNQDCLVQRSQCRA
jgi:hypothetical protein